MKKNMVYEKPQLVEYPYFGKVVASGVSPADPPSTDVPGAGSCSDAFEE